MPFVFTTFGLTCLANGLNSFRKVAQVFPIRDRQHAQGAARSDELLNGFHALGNRHVARLDEPNAVVDALLALQYALGRGRCEFRLLSPQHRGDCGRDPAGQALELHQRQAPLHPCWLTKELFGSLIVLRTELSRIG